MKKSVYSLVLMDNVIQAVDEMAYKLGTSRSNLINQILAEHLSCVTPEMRMRDIFRTFSELLGSGYQIQQNNSDSLITVRTALKYRYNPTLNYKVELMRSPNDYIGCLRVQIRTQSETLIHLFADFFEFWINLETSNLYGKLSADYSAEIENGKFSRSLFNTGTYTETQLGEQIYSYVNLLDKSIKLYFSDTEGFPSVIPKIDALYKKQMKSFII